MKPEAIKIVHTDGGFAVYALQTSIHPSAVFTSSWEVLDWIAERLAEWEPRESQAVESEAP